MRRIPPEEIGASGEIRTLKHLFLRQAAIPIRARWHMVHRGGFEPPRPTRGDRVTAGPFRRRAHAPVQTWRKVDESNAHGSSPCPGFRDQLPAIQQYLPHGGECGSGATPTREHRACRGPRSNPLASFREPGVTKDA